MKNLIIKYMSKNDTEPQFLFDSFSSIILIHRTTKKSIFQKKSKITHCSLEKGGKVNQKIIS